LSRIQIIAIHIDNGFMRLLESQRVVEALEHIGLKIHLIDGEWNAAALRA
jgi:GMP synthase PP-ATPase subunit